MSNQVSEEASEVALDAKAKVEKQARQLAYDTKYQVKKAMSGSTKMDPASVKRAYLQRLQRSTSSPAIKSRAKQMLLGEDYLNVDLEVENSVAKALFTVFVEGVVEEEVDEDISEETGERKYFVRVTDKKTGNTYRRWATRSKITELRANPNISSVELTEYGEADAEEKKKGAKTAAVKSGKGLDPVGKEDSDIDNDGKHNTKSDKYLLNRRKVRSDAIQNNEEYDFFGEASKENKSERKKIDFMKGKNKVDVFPDIKVQEDIAFFQEKSLSKSQQRFMGMVYATKKGEKAPSPEVAKAAEGISKSEAKKFAGTKHKGLPEKVSGEIKELSQSYELGGGLVDEAKAIGRTRSTDSNPKGSTVRVSSGRGMTMTPAKGLGASKPKGDDIKRKARYDDQVKKDRRAAAKERESSGEDRLGKLIRSIQKSSYQLEGDLVDEATAAAKRGLREPHRSETLKASGAREAGELMKTPQGKRELKRRSDYRRQKQTPEAQAKKKERDAESERISNLNRRPMSKKQKAMSAAVRASGSLGT
jgi:hypothetical protein